MLERAERLLDRHGVVEAMDLIEVDRLDAEPPQAALARLHDVLARQALPVRRVAHRPEHLRRDDDLVEIRHRPERAPGHFLAHAERVHVGRVEEVDAFVERESDERLRLAFVEHPRAPTRIAVGHAAEAQPGDGEACVAERRVLHSGVEVKERKPRRKGSSPRRNLHACRRKAWNRRNLSAR